MKLDQSHLTVLKNLPTFDRAQRCLGEVEGHIQSVVRDVMAEVNAKLDSATQFEFGKTYVQIRVGQNWRGTVSHLLSIGLMQFTVRALLTPSSPDASLRAYIYSDFLLKEKKEAFGADVQAIQGLRLPDGFVRAPSNYSGYLFVKEGSSLTAEDLWDRSKLAAFFEGHLVGLAKWLKQNQEAIAAIETQTTNSSSQ